MSKVEKGKKKERKSVEMMRWRYLTIGAKTEGSFRLKYRKNRIVCVVIFEKCCCLKAKFQLAEMVGISRAT